LIDGRGEKPVKNALIQVEGDQIVSVVDGGSVPPGFEVVDLANATVLPGCIDVHTQCTRARRCLVRGIRRPDEAMGVMAGLLRRVGADWD
jgi:N-acyl-D-aspartate/D-glutamate deacylase